jgi:endonuclease/exonuclease/phosphatase family metal-dependent hydrolase
VGVARPEEPFRLATYNLDNYLDRAVEDRPAKTAAARAKIRESIHALRPDVLALQEVGGGPALEELRTALKAEGLDYPFVELALGADPHIQVAVLSRFPIVERRSHTNESFLLRGRRFRVARGFAEVVIQVRPRYQFTLLAAHLKSRRAVPEADESELREQEAALLRQKIEARLRENPEVNLAVVGDFNDTKDSKAVMTLIGKRTAHALADLRPAERNGDNQRNPVPFFDPRNVTWTHYYGKQDTYSRIDYILVSRGMRAEWIAGGTYVLSLANWGAGSDHRPVVAEFTARDLPLGAPRGGR